MLEHIYINDMISIAKKAGDAIMEIYAKDFTIEFKNDKSPLTEADQKANDIIVDGLNTSAVKFPIISEEGREIPYGARKEWEYFWMVDPLDGTKEFIKKNGEFTVNIALIHQNTPILGAVYAPALDEMYSAKHGFGAFKNKEHLPLYVNKSPEKSLTVVVSKSHFSKETETFINTLKGNTQTLTFKSKGSSLKLCMVVEGSADIYPRLTPTMEWDTTAADAIVRDLYQADNSLPLQYNKVNLVNLRSLLENKYFIA